MSSLLSALQKRCDLSNQMLKQVDLFAAAGRLAMGPDALSSVVARETTRFANIIGDQGRQIDAAVGNFKRIGVGLRSDAVWKVFGEDLAKRSLGAAAAQVSDILKKTGGHLQAVWSKTLVSPAIPDLRSILPASIGLDLAQITASLNRPSLGPNHFLHHVLIVANEDSPEDEKLESLGFLREKTFKSGVAKKRRYAHRLRIQAAVNERATAGKSTKQVWAEVVEQAIFTVCAELKFPRNRACVVVDGKTRHVDGLVAWEDLGLPDLRRYMRNRISTEVMDNLVPNWREFDTKGRRRRAESIVSLQQADVDPIAHASISSHQKVHEKLTVESLLNHANLSADQRLLMRLMIEQDLSATDAGRSLGKGESWGRVTFSRVVTKLKKIS